MIIEMTHTEYMACHKDYRRVVRGRKELLVMDRETGKPSWVPVRIVPKDRKEVAQSREA